MINRYHVSQVTSGDIDAKLSRDALILKYTPYVKRMAGRIASQLPRGIDQEDLVHAGIVGLIEALDRFDGSRDNTFITFATFRIRGAILGELRARDVRSRATRQRYRDMKDVRRELEAALGRPADGEEIACAMGIDLEAYHDILSRAAVSVVSVEDFGYDGKGVRRRMIDELADAETADGLTVAGLKELTTSLARAVAELPEKDRLIVSLYYQDELTMKEIGRVLNITESRVSQLHARAVLALRERMAAAGLIEKKVPEAASK